MSSSKKNLPVRQVFLRVYRLEIQSVMLVFSTQLCELLSFSLFQLPPPLPFPVGRSQHTRIQCGREGGGGMWLWASDRKTPATEKRLPQSPFTGKNFLDDDILHCTFYELYLSTTYSTYNHIHITIQQASMLLY